MNLNTYLTVYHKQNAPIIAFPDGFTMSVQVNGPKIEVGNLSGPEPLLDDYLDTSWATSFPVYENVPFPVVSDVLEKHGGGANVIHSLLPPTKVVDFFGWQLSGFWIRGIRSSELPDLLRLPSHPLVVYQTCVIGVNYEPDENDWGDVWDTIEMALYHNFPGDCEYTIVHDGLEGLARRVDEAEAEAEKQRERDLAARVTRRYNMSLEIAAKLVTRKENCLYRNYHGDQSLVLGHVFVRDGVDCPFYAIKENSKYIVCFDGMLVKVVKTLANAKRLCGILSVHTDLAAMTAQEHFGIWKEIISDMSDYIK